MAKVYKGENVTVTMTPKDGKPIVLDGVESFTYSDKRPTSILSDWHIPSFTTEGTWATVLDSIERTCFDFLRATHALAEVFRYSKGQRKPKPRGKRMKALSRELWVAYVTSLRAGKAAREKRMARVRLAPPIEE
jgi:hypothetical protein